MITIRAPKSMKGRKVSLKFVRKPQRMVDPRRVSMEEEETMMRPMMRKRIRKGDKNA